MTSDIYQGSRFGLCHSKEKSLEVEYCELLQEIPMKKTEDCASTIAEG